MNMTNCNGDFELHSFTELEQQIRESSTYPFDDIWISGEANYPCLSILINGQYACIHYFLNNQGDMFQSIGYGHENIIFETNGEKSDMPANSIIPLHSAIECAKQFYETQKLPTCINWRDL